MRLPNPSHLAPFTLTRFNQSGRWGVDLRPLPLRTYDQGQPLNLFDPNALTWINRGTFSTDLRTPYLSMDLNEAARVK